MTEARVPHDPNDLRTAARHARRATGVFRYEERDALADRLEAWADVAPLEAAVLDALNEEDLWDGALALRRSGPPRGRGHRRPAHGRG